ncbi:MAG: triose-phosphate isomerase [Firmicutes bacterium]|jgi:triosephosphate isomerase|nr:triose-phosphate isomerase [Bacillota bacterium]
MRIPIVAGNWKMNKTVGEAVALAKELTERLPADPGAEVVVCPPFTALYSVGQILVGTTVLLGAQNLFWEEHGAFTGEVSPLMLQDLGVRYVIVGHSERRTILRETDEDVARKLMAAFKARLSPILCVGESLSEREAGQEEAVVARQLTAALAPLSAAAVAQLVIAYEPIWAIGTGHSAAPQDAATMAAVIRSEVAARFGNAVAEKVRVQYGGSVNAQNAASFLHQDGIDGALVGGASLKAVDFAAIVQAARR